MNSFFRIKINLIFFSFLYIISLHYIFDNEEHDRALKDFLDVYK